MPPKATVPKHIKDRIAANEKILEEGKQGTPPAAPAEPAAPPAASPSPTPPVETPPATPPVATPPTEQGIKPVSPTPPPTGGVEEQLKRAQAALRTANGRTSESERQYNELKKVVEPLKAENAQLASKIADLEKQIANLKASQPSKPETIDEDVQAIADELGITPEGVSRITKVILASMPKPEAPAAPSPAPAQPASQAAPSGSEPPASAGDTTKAAYIESLDALCGGEETRAAIVNDPLFKTFLAMKDGTSQRLIREIAAEADAARDAVTMAEVYRSFTEWKASAAKENKQPSHLMPASKGGPGDLNTNKKPIYSRAEVDEFQRKVKSGYYRTIHMSGEEAKARTDEYKRLSDEYAAARAEGRIRG